MEKEIYVVKPFKDVPTDYFVVVGGFEHVSLCEAEGSYRLPVGCYGAGCYAPDNSASSMREDLAKDFKKHFSQPLPASFHDAWVEGWLNEFVEALPDDYKKWVKDYIKNNTTHTEAVAFWYDGSWWVDGVDFEISNTHDPVLPKGCKTGDIIEEDGYSYRIIKTK